MANWPIDPGRQIQWAKQPEYTARLLSLVASLDDRADRHCVFTPKGTGKARIIADVTDKLFCTLPYDHDRVEKQRASVQRRINQIGSNYQSDIRALQYDPYRVQPVLDNIRAYNPHWDLIRSILHDHPDFPHWDSDEPDQFLQQQEEQDDRLGRAQMQDVNYHPIASGSGLHQQPQPPLPPAPAHALHAQAPSTGNSYRHDNYRARPDDPTTANAVAGPSNPRPIPSYRYPAAAAGAAAAGPIASGSGSTSASASASRSASASGARPSGALKRPRSPSSGNRSPSPQRRYVPGPAAATAGAGADADANATAARERQLAAREQAVIDGYKRIGLGQLDVAAAVVPQQPFDSLAAREAAIEERERHLEEAIAEIAAFDAYQDLQRQAEVVQPPPPPAVHPAAAPAPAPAPVQQPAPPPAAQAAPANANANAPPDPNANANPNANPNANANHDPNHAAAVAVEAEAEDEPPLAECPKCSFPLSAVPAADAESHLRACLDSEGASLAECPVCEASLSGMESAAERERHVDACCRGLGGTSTADGGGAAAAGADESSGPGARAALAAGRGNGEAKRQKREHVVFVSDEKTIPKDEKTGQPLECIMCFDEFEAEQRLARLSCYCLYHEECIVSYWENPSKFCPTHRELDTTPEVQMRAI